MSQQTEGQQPNVPMPVPRDRRFIVRALSPAKKLARTRARNAFKCSGCRSPSIVQLAEGANLWRCQVCHCVLRMDRNQQCSRTRLSIEQALAKVAQQSGQPKVKRSAKKAQSA